VKPQGKKVTDLEAATSLMVSSYTDGNEVVTIIINYTDKEEPMELKLDKAKKGKVYVTSIDKNLEYAGEHALKKLSIPARSVVTVVAEAK
jgi:O-glycosyl hydrolase